MVARATWSKGANLACIGEGAPTLNLVTGCDQDLFYEHCANPVMWSEVNWRIGVTTRPFEIQHDEHYLDYRSNRPCSDYNESTYELDLEHGCQTIFSHDVAGFIGIAVLRGRKDGKADPGSVDRFEYLSPIIARALKVEMALAGEGIRLALGGQAAARSSMALINRHGWACGMSPAAEEMIDEGMPIRCRGPRLAMSNPVDDMRFQQLLAFMLHHDRNAGHAVRMVVGAAPLPTWKVTVAHIPPGDLSLGFEPHVTVIVEPIET